MIKIQRDRSQELLPCRQICHENQMWRLPFDRETSQTNITKTHTGEPVVSFLSVHRKKFIQKRAKKPENRLNIDKPNSMGSRNIKKTSRIQTNHQEALQ